ncbi:uncharacterized protein EV154DRAFT_553790 [Mucor mucedo]|uniref:uncharacterized protein n=1 Tax=Mucor mucedo TaxID=29922 RepID=UPI00221FA707|nr:uncharacterized protein EV154DRAFT_553790 [Mucor mucedo]KAI7888572.1 hypothetical protein EV154DRAFT_553790 [Mucor mucedo]
MDHPKVKLQVYGQDTMISLFYLRGTNNRVLVVSPGSNTYFYASTTPSIYNLDAQIRTYKEYTDMEIYTDIVETVGTENMDSSAKLNELAEFVQDQNNEDRVEEEQDIPMPIQMLPRETNTDHCDVIGNTYGNTRLTIRETRLIGDNHISKLCDTDGGITGYTVDIEILGIYAIHLDKLDDNHTASKKKKLENPKTKILPYHSQ